MRKTNLQVAFDTWGPIKITVDNRTQELWGKVSRKSLHLAFIALLGSRARTLALARLDKDEEVDHARI
jgi:hypothetical protein